MEGVRLYDRLMADPDVPRDIKRLWGSAPVFDISNCITGLRSLDERAAISDIGAPFALPFPRVAIEYQWQREWIQPRRRDWRGSIRRVGFFCLMGSNASPAYPGRCVLMSPYVLVDGGAFPLFFGDNLVFGLDEDWCLATQRQVLRLSLSENGEVLEVLDPEDEYDDAMTASRPDRENGGLLREDGTPWRGWRTYLAEPVMYAIALLNCKNIGTREVLPDPKFSRAFRRRHGSPIATYRVLTIVPGGSAVRRSGGVEPSADTLQPHHLVRGHFKTYTPERPLLGKYIGRFFWHPQARGHSPAGIVTKDYSVASPVEVPHA